jgi:hypothetical protein
VADGDGATPGQGMNSELSPEERAARFADPGPAQVSDGDLSTSPEALTVLAEEGVDAWRAWVAERQVPQLRAEAPPDPVVDEVDDELVLGDDDLVSGPPLSGEHERARETSGRRLREYWTRGPGLAKWVSSPTPWRTLHRFLSKYLSGAKLDATTSAWYRIVFGRLPGQD